MIKIKNMLFIVLISLLVACNNNLDRNNKQMEGSFQNQDAVSDGEIGDAWLGITAGPISIEEFRSIHPDSSIDSINGVLIFTVENQSPIEQCKLDMNKENFLIEVDEIIVNDNETCINILSKKKPNEYMNIKIDSYDENTDSFVEKKYSIKLGSKKAFEEAEKKRIAEQESIKKEKYKNSKHAYYIGDKDVDYRKTEDIYTIQWSASETDGGERIPYECKVGVRIVDDNGIEIYNSTYEIEKENYTTWTWNNGASKFLGTIYIKPNELKKASTSSGKVYLDIVGWDGSTWNNLGPEKITNLPKKGVNISVPNIPYKFSNYGYNGQTLQYTATLLEFNIEPPSYDGGSCKYKCKIKMDYNSKGSGESSSITLGYKIKDNEGVIVGSGTIFTSQLAVGETIKEDGYLHGDLDLNHSYTLEFSSTHK